MKDFEEKIRTHLAERGWDRLRPSDVAKSVMIEGAELLEIFQWDNQEPEEVRADEKKMVAIRKELADVMIYCFDMAVILGIDVKSALEEKLAKAAEKYPVEMFNPNSHGENPGTEELYWKVKEEYRKEGKN